ERQVLALKYRPKRFEDLIGQDTISTTLSLALDTNRLSHAYLLSGLRGSGKTSTARIMAKALVCQNAPTSKPCESCDSCKSANENRHLDIIEMDAASNRGIDDIKDLIEHTKYKPTSAKYKVFIIDEVHMLTTQAFNALLKTLEEPPDFVKFILATTDPLKLPATILSRTQHFRFKRISDKNIIHHLSHILNIENVQFETPALQILTRSGQGSLRDTLTLLDQAIIFSKSIITVGSVTDMLGMIDPSFLDELFTTILNKGDIRPIVESLESYEVGQVLDEISIYLKQKMLLNDIKFDLYLFDRFFRIIADSKQLLNMNSDSGFVLILTLSKMVEAVSIKTIDEMIREVQDTPVINEKVNRSRVQEESVVTNTAIQEEKIEEPTVVHEEVVAEDNSAESLFKKLIQNIYSKNYDLGECFENNFTFSSYENNVLKINSTATGECRSLLYKNFSHIKIFVSEVFGDDTELEFEKIEKEKTKEMARVVQPSNNNNVGSMIEDIELHEENPSSCVASMSAMKKPNLSQIELNIDDVLNSKMTNTAIQLLQPRNPVKIKSKL
ncbi:DNA polymerase III subunit gamma/tau, partial [Arcobacteraceae bacterium]|nr:DNA polymerase III subunit gamma/tau [Arcobacteraceae bacterium]